MRLNKWQEAVLGAAAGAALCAACVVVMVIGLVVMVQHPVWWGLAVGFVICCVAGLLAFTLGYSGGGWVLARIRRLQHWLRDLEREDTEQDAA